MTLVIDASIALAWCFEDEASPESDAIAERVRQSGAIVPGLFALEIGNILLQGERKGRLSAAAVSERLELLGQLGWSRMRRRRAAPGAIRKISRAHRLTSYGAAYLELATRDRDLAPPPDRSACPCCHRAGCEKVGTGFSRDPALTLR
ncbi:type II toxin-antitoxin system VapC family toxin [Bosea sp. LjRoot9]|uniref:type II toxin-antitoxin system VapC family toxin n=1 Tax=Bosea sp. LjRoot9 TaxID=3342341 RepID=UPI003ECD9869